MSDEKQIDHANAAALSHALVYEAGVRLLANATTGRYSTDTLATVTARDLLLRWAEREGGEFDKPTDAASREGLVYWTILGKSLTRNDEMKANLDEKKAH